jgi:hypothetical protein
MANKIQRVERLIAGSWVDPICQFLRRRRNSVYAVDPGTATLSGISGGDSRRLRASVDDPAVQKTT